MNDCGQKLVARCLFVSLDGFMAGDNQRLDQPFGDHVEGFHDWFFATKTGAQMIGRDGGEEGLDNSFLAAAFDNIGASIMGRNMFAPSRGPWTDDDWTGWWGPNPPYHSDVFVLTHHPRASIPKEGGTTFHFVTDGIASALERAFDAADGKDVRLNGGADVVRQYLRAGLVDELHLVIVPVLIGAGARLLDGVEIADNYRCVEHSASPAVTHVRLERVKEG
ncbi:MAG: dihydrofolate reductase family protein [Acidimicrobiia bacterium]